MTAALPCTDRPGGARVPLAEAASAGLVAAGLVAVGPVPRTSLQPATAPPARRPRPICRTGPARATARHGAGLGRGVRGRPPVLPVAGSRPRDRRGAPSERALTGRGGTAPVAPVTRREHPADRRADGRDPVVGAGDRRPARGVGSGRDRRLAGPRSPLACRTDRVSHCAALRERGDALRFGGAAPGQHRGARPVPRPGGAARGPHRRGGTDGRRTGAASGATSWRAGAVRGSSGSAQPARSVTPRCREDRHGVGRRHGASARPPVAMAPGPRLLWWRGGRERGATGRGARGVCPGPLAPSARIGRESAECCAGGCGNVVVSRRLRSGPARWGAARSWPAAGRGDPLPGGRRDGRRLDRAPAGAAGRGRAASGGFTSTRRPGGVPHSGARTAAVTVAAGRGTRAGSPR